MLQYLRALISNTLPSLGIVMKHFHSDGGAELVALTVLSFVTQLASLYPIPPVTRLR